MAFWTCREAAKSTPHAHDYDEYFVVLQGCYMLIIDGERIPVCTGEEYFIPQGKLHGGELTAGTRTIHALRSLCSPREVSASFGEQRAISRVSVRKIRYNSVLRRGTQVVRERSAKPLYVGSIPTRASNCLV